MRTRAGADLSTLAAAYVEDLRSRRYSASAIEKAQLELGRLTYHLREKMIDARAVTEAHLAAYAHSLAEHTTRAGQPLAPASRAAASTLYAPRTFVSMKSAASWIDRSTCDSAAKFTTASQPRIAATTAGASATLPCTNA